MNNEKAKNVKQEGEKLRKSKYENHKVQKDLWNCFERSTKFLEMSTIMKLTCGTCRVGLEESWTNLESSWNS